jgi:hypothetical protein
MCERSSRARLATSWGPSSCARSQSPGCARAAQYPASAAPPPPPRSRPPAASPLPRRRCPAHRVSAQRSQPVIVNVGPGPPSRASQACIPARSGTAAIPRAMRPHPTQPSPPSPAQSTQPSPSGRTLSPSYGRTTGRSYGSGRLPVLAPGGRGARGSLAGCSSSGSTGSSSRPPRARGLSSSSRRLNLPAPLTSSSRRLNLPAPLPPSSRRLNLPAPLPPSSRRLNLPAPLPGSEPLRGPRAELGPGSARSSSRAAVDRSLRSKLRGGRSSWPSTLSPRILLLLLLRLLGRASRLLAELGCSSELRPDGAASSPPVRLKSCWRGRSVRSCGLVASSECSTGGREGRPLGRRSRAGGAAAASTTVLHGPVGTGTAARARQSLRH